MDFLQLIRKRSREGWEQLALNKWTDLRIWVQEHGEPAALIALVAGIVFVLFFKPVLLLLVAAALVYFVILYLAIPEGTGGSAGSSGRSLSAQEEETAGRGGAGKADSSSQSSEKTS